MDNKEILSEEENSIILKNSVLGRRTLKETIFATQTDTLGRFTKTRDTQKLDPKEAYKLIISDEFINLSEEERIDTIEKLDGDEVLFAFLFTNNIYYDRETSGIDPIALGNMTIGNLTGNFVTKMDGMANLHSNKRIITKNINIWTPKEREKLIEKLNIGNIFKVLKLYYKEGAIQISSREENKLKSLYIQRINLEYSYFALTDFYGGYLFNNSEIDIFKKIVLEQADSEYSLQTLFHAYYPFHSKEREIFIRRLTKEGAQKVLNENDKISKSEKRILVSIIDENSKK